MHMPKNKRKINIAGLGVLLAVLVLCELASAAVLFSRMISYTEAKFVNVMPLTDEAVTETDAQTSPDETASPTGTSAPDEPFPADTTPGGKHPEFRMEAEAEIFRFSYDETGKVTVIGVEGNPDKLIAPGTSNLYQFTLQNPGDVPLDYTLTMEAYITGTDLWLPVYARVWDYKNDYLLGSQDSMVDVLELNTVGDSAELGAGRYAVYNLEWEWPFERGEGDELTLNDIYDTMLGNLAVDEDLTLHIVIRTYAEYDEAPEDPNAGELKPPQTGDNSGLALLILLFAGSFVGFVVILVVFFRSDRKEKQAKRI